MKLAISKDSTVELELLEETGGVSEHGRLFNVSDGAESPRYSRLVNNAVSAFFEMPEVGVTEGAKRAARTAAKKIKPATFLDKNSKLLRLVYKEIAVRFAENVTGAASKKILAKYGLSVRRHGQYDPRLLIVYDPRRRIIGARVVEVANELMKLDEVESASPNFVSEFKRARVPMPNAGQWHLSPRNGGKDGADINVRAAWELSMGSPQIVIAVLDDGVDVEHPNLRENILSRPDPNNSNDLVGRDFFIADSEHPDHFNPRPKRLQYPYDQMKGNDIHGTPCAGLAAASGRVDGVYGVAPLCRILPVKIFHADELASEERVADAIAYAARFADVLSCSWSSPASAIIEAALADAARGMSQNRRRERGTPIFFAAGNAGEKSVAYPASSQHTICVGATTAQATTAKYSNEGREMWISAPGGDRDIMTTDLSYAHRGFNVGKADEGGESGLHTNKFDGTSAATPIAAGVAALVLSVNAELTREGVKEVLRDSADKIGPKNSYKGEPAHSRAFGYGRVNAGAAADAAKRLRPIG